MTDGRILTLSFRARSGSADRVAELLAELADASRAEAGCLSYEVGRNEAERDRFVIVERWADEAAFDIHRETEHFRRLAPEIFPGLVEDVVRQWWARLVREA